MKRLALIIIIAITLIPVCAKGQELVTHRNIGLDSLISLLHKASNSKVYYVEGESSRNLIFTVKDDDTLLESIKDKLHENGYVISEYNDALFVLKGKGLESALPKGYFSKGETRSVSVQKDYIDALENVSNVAVSQNKIYEIGDRDKQSEKVYLSGYVRDSRTGEPVIGVVLFDNKSKSVATSDAHGFYKMLLPGGECSLDVSGYSLEDLKVNLKLFSDGNLDVVVKEKVFALNSVVVSAENTSKLRNTEIGIERVRIDRIKKVPSVFGEADVVKIILTLPGVKSVGEASSGFNVRGGATDQNLVLFNEGTVYNPSHLFGMFSAFNPDVVNDIELYKSSIPVVYGGRISSVLDVQSREGNNKEITGSLGLGLLTTRGHIEGPITKKTTFIAGARATYSDWMLKLLPDDSGYRNGSASFYDGTLGLHHKFNEKNSLHVNGYYSRDGFKFSSDTSYKYENINASIKWKSSLGDKHSLELATGYDHYNYATYDKSNYINAYEMSFKINQGFAKLCFKSIWNEKHTITYGVESTYYNLLPGSYLPYGNASMVKPDRIDTEIALEGAAYVSDSWKVTDKLTVDYGIRYSLFNSDKFYSNPEFRVSGRYIVTQQISVKAGFNSMSQYIHMLSNSTSISPTDIWKLSDKDIKPQTGWQAAAGIYAGLFNNKAELSVEGYYKRMNNYLDYKSGAVLLMNKDLAKDVIETMGKAYGVEVMIKKPLGKLNGWLSYTYSKTQLKDDKSRQNEAVNGGRWYNAAFDKPHDIKLVGNYKFTHRISVSVNGDYSTGRPVTVPLGKYYYSGGYQLYYGPRNTYRIPDYFRLDMALNVEPTHKIRAFTHFSFTVGVYNVTGRKNAYSIYFETEGDKVKGHKLCVFGAPIPYVNLNFKF